MLLQDSAAQTLAADALEAQERTRIAAMVAGDIATLDALLDERLIFGHTNGHAENKASYLARLNSGTVRYADADLRIEQVTVLGETGLVRARLTMRADVASGPLHLDVTALTVWRLEGQVWRLVAHQPTVMPR